MHKNNQSFILLLTSLILSLTNLCSAQLDKATDLKKEGVCNAKPFVKPQSVDIRAEIFSDYRNVMSQPRGDRQQVFSKLTAEQKADVYRIHIAFQLIKRTYLNEEQKNLILETIASITPDTYQKDGLRSRVDSEKKAEILQARSLSLFPPNEALEIFASMNGDKTFELGIVNGYETVLSWPTMAERKQHLRELTSTDRSDFWKAQMILYLATAKIGDSQRRFIAMTLPFLTPKAFDFPQNIDFPRNEETLLLDSLEIKANSLFSKEEIFVIFMSQGFHKTSTPRAVTIESGVPLPEAPASCDCNWVCGALCWACSNTQCNASTDGCGWYGDKSCQSYCILMQNCP